MRLTRCENGHFYDQDMYMSCPHCGKDDSVNASALFSEPDPLIHWDPLQNKPYTKPVDMPAELGNTEIMEELGQGSTGQVYRIRQITEYAVKVIHWGKNTNRENAVQEFKMASQLRKCPFIIPYYGYYEKDHVSYLLQELSTPWFKWYLHHSCTVEDVLCGILNVLKAIREIHLAGLAHFDIKPGNLFVTDYGVRLGDFSHAYPVQIGENYPGPRGTRPYMAPEVEKCAAYNGTEDVYSLGITMYSLLTGGELPYSIVGGKAERQENDRIQTLFMHPDLIHMIEKATAYDPENRYQKPEEFEKAINDFMAVNFLLMTQKIPAYSGKDHSWNDSSRTLTLGTEDSDTGTLHMQNPDYTSMAFPFETGHDEVADISRIKTDSVTDNDPLFSALDHEKEQITPPKIDDIRFTAAGDCAVNRGDLRILEIAMYTDMWEKTVLAEIRQEIGENYQSYTSGKLRVEKKTTVTVQISAPDIHLEEDTDTQIWNGNYLKFVFDYAIPEDYAKNQVLFRAKVFFNGIPATTLRLLVPLKLGKVQAETSRMDIRSAFMSYARQDMNIVTYIVQAIHAVRPDLDLFFDLENLHAGEYWKDRVKEELLKRDMMYLCWSKNAAKSEWVALEWKYMAEQKGLDAITPIPLDGPDICPVPEGLTEMHFDELEVLIRNAKLFSEKGQKLPQIKKLSFPSNQQTAKGFGRMLSRFHGRKK